MATLSTTSLNFLADEWEKVYKTATLSGIVGDLAHKARGGYHISRQDQPSGNYSVIRPDDKPGNGPNDRAAAIDMTMSTADIIKCHTRLRTLWQNRANDSRWKYVNAWNGWDGDGDAGRYDVVKGTVSTASDDHKWHIHLEIRRKYVNDMNAMQAVLSLLKGESASGSVPPAPATSGDDDMTQDEFTKFLQNALNDPNVSTQLRARPWQYTGGGISAGYSTLGALNEIHLIIKAMAETIARESTSPEELKAALDNLPGETSDAVVKALGGQTADELANVLRGVLTPEKVAQLKAVL